MSDNKEDFDQQMAAARKGMSRYCEALSALAGNDTSEEFKNKLEVARERMKKYEVAYRGLANS